VGSKSSERAGNRRLLLARGTLWGALAGASTLVGAMGFNLASGGRAWSFESAAVFAAPALLVGALCGLLVAAVGWRFVRRRLQTASQRASLVLIVALSAAVPIAVVALGLAWFAEISDTGFMPTFAVWMLVLAPALPVCLFAIWHTRRSLLRRENAVTQCMPVIPTI